MRNILQLLAGQTGRSEDELQKFVDKFQELADVGKQFGINFKALVDEATGDEVSAAELSGGITEQIVSMMNDADMEIPNDMPEMIRMAIEETLADFTTPVAETAESGMDEEEMEAFRQWAEKSVDLMDNLLDVATDVTAVEDRVIEMSDQIKSMGRAIKLLSRQIKSYRPPASQAPETEVIDIPDAVLKMAEELISAQQEDSANGSKLVPSDYRK